VVVIDKFSFLFLNNPTLHLSFDLLFVQLFFVFLLFIGLITWICWFFLLNLLLRFDWLRFHLFYLLIYIMFLLLNRYLGRLLIFSRFFSLLVLQIFSFSHFVINNLPKLTLLKLLSFRLNLLFQLFDKLLRSKLSVHALPQFLEHIFR